MEPLYILNESDQPDQPGDVNIFRNIDSLLGYVEAIDVRNNEYLTFTTDGRKITLSAEEDYAPVSADIEEKPQQQDVVMRLLHAYLLRVAEDGHFGIDEKAATDAKTLDDLAELIPEKLITEYK